MHPVHELNVPGPFMGLHVTLFELAAHVESVTVICDGRQWSKVCYSEKSLEKEKGCWKTGSEQNGPPRTLGPWWRTTFVLSSIT